MSGSQAKLHWGHAVGAYLRQDRIVLTEVGSTPAGTAVLRRHVQTVNSDGPAQSLRQWLETHLTPRQRRHVPVCIGIGAERVLFTTRFLDDEQRKGQVSPYSVLEACGALHAWNKDDAAADCTKTKLPGGVACSVAAVRRELADELLGVLREAGVRSARLEPAPWSLLRAADRHAKPPKRWKLTVRVLLDEADGLAMLVVADRPVLWRRFAVDERAAALSVTSAIRALQIYARQAFHTRAFSGVFLQGSLREGLVERVRDETGMEVLGAGGEGPTDGQYSLALALSAKEGKDDELDLLRELRPPPSIREILPWKLATLILFLGGCMTFLLWSEAAGLATQCERLERQDVSRAWARPLSTQAIRNERKVLAAEVGAVRKFLATRIIWSDYLRDMPTRLPPNTCLSSLNACCELADMGKKKQKRKANQSMTLRGMARYSERTQTPRDIDMLLESLRHMELLQHDFPLVRLAEIKWRKEGKSEIAMFTILAQPKQGNKGK